MAIIVLLEGEVKDGAADTLETILTNIFPDTRSYDGCRGITAGFDSKRKTVILVEYWDTQAHYDKYLSWRKETGVLDELLEQLEGGPSIRYFDRSGA